MACAPIGRRGIKTEDSSFFCVPLWCPLLVWHRFSGKKEEMEWALLNASINTFELGQAPKKFRTWETGDLELIWLKLKCTFCSQRAYRQKRQYLLDRNGALTAISKLLIYKGQTAAERYHLKLCVIEMLNLNVTLMWNRFQETILRLDLILKAWHSQTKKIWKMWLP